MLEGSILQQLAATRTDGKAPLNLGVYYKNTLVALCHALEDFILTSSDRPLMVTFFQEGKWYLQEAERYGAIADKADRVAIVAAPGAGFAEHPTSQKSNVAVVGIDPSEPIAREWHLMILSPTYTAMVLCQELSDADYGPAGRPTEDLERKFYGFWTFEPELVQTTVELAIDHIERYDAGLAKELQARATALRSDGGQQQRDELHRVVPEVVRYLQRWQEDLIAPGAADRFAHSSALDDNLLSNELQALLRMAQLIDRADTKNPNAGNAVTSIVEALSQLLDLPAWQVKRLRLAALLHRLDPLQAITATKHVPNTAEEERLPEESLLRVMPQLQAIAKIVGQQYESWDGSGQPDGLAYDAIPLESRLLALAITFQQQLAARRDEPQEEALPAALAACQAEAGTRFDPKLVETLSILAMGMLQGMPLPTASPKIASGVWLLDSDRS
ncbi:MAG: DICT sensory domain-containing protein [Cyanobacteria bacterium J06641_5]